MRKEITDTRAEIKENEERKASQKNQQNQNLFCLKDKYN